MAIVSSKPSQPTREQREHMHTVYREGGMERNMAPHILYQEPISAEEAAQLPQLPDDWHVKATIL